MCRRCRRTIWGPVSFVSCSTLSQRVMSAVGYLVGEPFGAMLQVPPRCLTGLVGALKSTRWAVAVVKVFCGLSVAVHHRRRVRHRAPERSEVMMATTRVGSASQSV